MSTQTPGREVVQAPENQIRLSREFLEVIARSRLIESPCWTIAGGIILGHATILICVGIAYALVRAFTETGAIGH